jgi:hypothetical protein
MPQTKIDLTGQRFGHLVVISWSHYDKKSYWNCLCDCGTTCCIGSANLRSGNSQSCGCGRGKLSQIEPRKKYDGGKATGQRTHGLSRDATGARTPEYASWSEMRNRCYNPKATGYKHWGGRGITVCDRWRYSFENFLADMGPRPQGTTLDRYPNNDGNYEPGNCRWATWLEQAATRRKKGSAE